MKPVRVSYILEKLHKKGVFVQIRNYKSNWEVHMFPDLKSIALSNFPVIKGNGTNLDEAVRLAFIDFATRLKTEKNINIIEFLEDKIVAL